MKERDLEAEEPPLRALVDQLGALRRELVERLADVGDLVGDVVHSRPALGEELPDGRLFAEPSTPATAARRSSGISAVPTVPRAPVSAANSVERPDPGRPTIPISSMRS